MSDSISPEFADRIPAVLLPTLQETLKPGESILWIGKPDEESIEDYHRRLRLMFGSCAGMGVLLAGLVVWNAIWDHGDTYWDDALLVLAAVSFVGYCARYLLLAKRPRGLSDCAYVITNTRAVSLEIAEGRARALVFEPADESQIEHQEYRESVGHIVFHPPNDAQSSVSNDSVAPGFTWVADVDGVAEQLRQLARQSS